MNEMICESCGAIYEGGNVPVGLECLCKSKKFKVRVVNSKPMVVEFPKRL